MHHIKILYTFLKIFLFLSFFFNNKFFIGVQFANIQNNTQGLSRQVPPPVPITHSPYPPPSSPSTTPSSFPSVRSLYVLSPFLIFPTHFFSLPFYSLSLLFIFPKWMRRYNVCPSPIDLFHFQYYYFNFFIEENWFFILQCFSHTSQVLLMLSL